MQVFVGFCAISLLFVVEPDNRHYKNGNHQHTDDNCYTILNELILTVDIFTSQKLWQRVWLRRLARNAPR